MSSLARLNLRQNDIKYLEEQGYLSIEAIAIASRYDLGFSKKKAERVIQSAQNIILNEQLLHVIIENQHVKVFVKDTNTTIKRCVADQFGLWSEASKKKIEVDEIHCCYILPREGYVEGYAESWKTKLALKKQSEECAKGITMDAMEIREFAEEIGFEGFAKNVFQEIKGNDIMKKSLSIALFSTFNEPCHICILGEPGSSKTLAYDLISRYISDVVPIGGNTTKAGLVINLATGELGALASSNQKIVIADEFDKIPKSDIPYTYELLSNGKCRVDSGKIHQTIESHFIFIAMGNPKKEVFKKRPIEQIGLPPALMSRFALIVKTERLEKEDRLELFKKKFYQDFTQLENPEKYLQWVRLARIFQPEILVSDVLIEYYIESVAKIVNGYYHTPLRRDLRMGDYLRRIPFSIARANFSDVTEEILDMSLDIIRESIATWQN